MALDPATIRAAFNKAKKYVDDTLKGMGAIKGEDGTTFTPAVSEAGIISWTNDGGLPNPQPVNIKGPAGDDGDTPYIGENGNWWIGETDTGVPASGGGGGGGNLDANPIGAVIAYMGSTAPSGYLVCDGATYSISSYPDLANLFASQFGSTNRFGGDGVSTFAVPDMRNLFLRGYHGDAEDALSGDIGALQEATVQPGLYQSISSGGAVSIGIPLVKNDRNVQYRPKNFDDTVKLADGVANITFTGEISDIDPSTDKRAVQYSARPENMAVLYCIKAVAGGGGSGGGDSSGGVTMDQVNAAISEALASYRPEIYSKEETVIGTWIDGRPLYRVVVSGNLGDYGAVTSTIWKLSDLTFSGNPRNLQNAYGYLIDVHSNPSYMFPCADCRVNVGYGNWNPVLEVDTSRAGAGTAYVCTLEYTKTTDPIPAQEV